MTHQSASDFYLSHGEWSDPKRSAAAFDVIEPTAQAAISAVQGVFLHDYFGAHLYHDPPPGMAKASRATMPVADRLPTLDGFNESPLTQKRPPSRRMIGTCRDFALLSCAVLRHHGIAARVRCGFARYFHPPTFEDHWICEYWHSAGQTWKRADAQLDAEHKRHLSIAFDPADIPKDQFLFPWEVWQIHRDDPSGILDFGHGDATGFWFLRVNLARDFLALTKREVSNWDTWREHCARDKVQNDQAIALCDQLAIAAQELTMSARIDTGSFEGLVASLGVPHWHG